MTMEAETAASSSSSASSSAHTISILVATDNHLGYLEKDPVRGQDSFQTFEEILRLAQLHEVDMILLGGDLFHDNKPSRACLHKTMSLLRQYCMGDRPCALDFQSDPRANFADQFGTVNYQDPNYNVAMPVFSIHGNHDDPSGDGNLCALDLLAVSGLCNYFGRAKQIDDIAISPLLMRKGSTRLALYGLGNIRDERLYRTFVRRKVKVLRPREETDAWFNLMVIHQNRFVGLLKVQGTRFKLRKLPLQTVRPFIMKDVVLANVDGLRPSDEKGILRYLTNTVGGDDSRYSAA
ncbi:Metallo-dependent phosphatase-like protein [Syncephalis pseudoplumigaleata]|uniref:Metallo-dependent phosphatase-like protein n=1 Tax=Syncephalis pseudoplumigaleata TaxID=1712513 RepID=A0A4P9YQY4_9FUNG|nr:Metallo-dependent phosphatase-like protein [Syncephalis pseudoplumigaleata]|eukprot:RKP22236.1 Metallo-dependent phosphatase-like protein [Syncephalis pseudoplumigaleata]